MADEVITIFHPPPISRGITTKYIKASVILLTLTTAPAAFAAESINGIDMKPAGHAKQLPKPVAMRTREIHLDIGKITLKHDAIDNLGMGAMTMTFTMKDKASLKNLEKDQSVLAVFDMVDSQPTVVDLRNK